MPDSSINLIQQAGPAVVETICGPVSDFKELTLSSNVHIMAWLGFFSGALMVILFLAGLRYGPALYDRYLSWKARRSGNRGG